MSERSSPRYAIAWAVLALAGQAAALSLVKAGHSVGYQHYLPIAELPAHPLGLAILVAQALVVGWALRGSARELFARLYAVLPGWRLAALVIATGASAATVGRDIPRWLGESIFACVVQLVSLATIVLCVRAIPPDALTSVRTILDRMLGANDASSPAERPRLDRFSLLTAIGVAVACALLAVVVYERHPHLEDEVAYLFQARTFAIGRLTVPAPPVPHSFDLFLLDVAPSGWYSPVPPGWALVLVPGEWIGAPWLVNPLLAGANILLAYLVIQVLYDRRTARLATLLLAVSPWNLSLGMGFMPHAATLTCALIATVGVIVARRTGHSRWTWLAGAALGLLAAIRQLDAMIMAAALGLWAIGVGGTRLRVAAIIGLVAGSMVFATPLLIYNKHFTGKAGHFPMMAYNDSLYGKGANDYGFGKNRGMGWALDPNPGHGPVDGVINATLNTTATQVVLFGWSIGSLLLMYAFVFAGRLTRADRLMLGVIAITFTAYFFNYFAGGPDFGARYWYLMIVPFVALTARGALTLGDRLSGDGFGGTRMLAAVMLLIVSATVVFVPWQAVDKYWHYRGMRADLRTLQRERSFGSALILVAGREVPDYASAMPYNPLDLRAPVPVYARRRDGAADSAVIRAYAGRPVWFVDGPTVSHGGYSVRAGPLSSDDALRLVGNAPASP